MSIISDIELVDGDLDDAEAEAKEYCRSLLTDDLSTPVEAYITCIDERTVEIEDYDGGDTFRVTLTQDYEEVTPDE